MQVLGFNKKHVCKRNQELNELNNLPNSNIVNRPCLKEMDHHSLGEQPINPQDISDEELLQIVQVVQQLGVKIVPFMIKE